MPNPIDRNTQQDIAVEGVSETAETESFRGFALLWLLHQIIAFVGGFAIVFALIEARVSHAPAWVGLSLMFLGELFLGYATPRSRSGLGAAMLVWFLPTLAFVAGFLWDWYDFGLARTAAYFFARDLSGDDDTLATALITIPTAWAIIYSVGAAAKKWFLLSRKRSG